MGKSKFVLALALFVCDLARGDCGSSLTAGFVDPSKRGPFVSERWIARQEQQSKDLLMKNVSPPGTAPGSILASTSSHYHFHWVRDAALVMTMLPEAYFENFLKISRIHQVQSGPENLGEAKYWPDGRPYEGPWARPQNDGPAARVIVISQFVEAQVHKGIDPHKIRRDYFLDPKHGHGSLNKAFVLREDLEFLIKNWKEQSADLWEEVFADSHVYTLMSFESAFRHGMTVASLLGEQRLAQRLQDALHEVDRVLMTHRAADGTIEAIRGIRPGWNPHVDNFDASVILAINYFSVDSSLFRISSPETLATAYRLIQNAREDFPAINSNRAAPAIGRYRGDAWTGYERHEPFSGNPWTLITAAFSEFHYRLAMEYMHSGGIQITKESLPFFKDLMSGVMDTKAFDQLPLYEYHQQEFSVIVHALKSRGDQFLRRVQDSAGGDGSLSEQISKTDATRGVGPENLSWSHMATLRALHHRNLLLRYIN